MSAELAAPACTNHTSAVSSISTVELHNDERENAFLPLTTEVGPTVEAPRNVDAKIPSAKTEPAREELAARTKSTNEGIQDKRVEQGGRERASTSSSIWSTAAETLKNFVLGKPQPQPSEIVTVVRAPGTRPDPGSSTKSAEPSAKIDKGKGRAVSTDFTALPLNDGANASSAPSQKASKPSSQQRPSAPPPRLSSIAHSLPTSHATVPSPPTPPAFSTSPSTQSPQSATSQTSNATNTSGTTATDEENQAAALAALNAVIHSVGTGYTQPLTSRAAQLHLNDLMLAQQREKLLHTTNLLAKDTVALQKLALESNNKLKSFGDLSNWTSTLDNDLSAVEETLRIVDRGTLELCAKCEEGIAEDDHQRWCGVCGKGFHEACAPEDPPSSVNHQFHPTGLGDDYNEGDEEDHNPCGDRGQQSLQPQEVALPDSLPSTSHHLSTGAAGPTAAQAYGTIPPTIPFTQPSVPKPSSMFEWGGIPDVIKDIAALREHNDSESEFGSGSGSEWSGEDWRCQECRLKDDLDGIVMGL